jgi:hypothetical protein
MLSAYPGEQGEQVDPVADNGCIAVQSFAAVAVALLNRSVRIGHAESSTVCVMPSKSTPELGNR